MTTQETVEALIAWADETLPELSTPHSASESDWPLPDIAVAVTEIAAQDSPYQHGHVRRRSCVLILAVEPEPPDSAATALYGFCDRLMDELVADQTLGGRVSGARQTARARIEPSETEFDDGSSARLAAFEFSVEDARPQELR